MVDNPKLDHDGLWDFNGILAFIALERQNREEAQKAAQNQKQNQKPED